MDHSEHVQTDKSTNRSMAISATLHCLTGCAIGEILGLVIGTVLGFPTYLTIALSISLAFVFGYALSMVPLLKFRLSLKQVLRIVLLADTLSILTMEIVDNAVMALVPGAMDSGLVNPLFWMTLALALTAAFLVAVPVNQRLLERGKGHALVHQYHQGHEGHA